MNNTIKNARLREIRKQAGVTQQEIADYLNMSRGSYQYLEAKGIITADILVKLSRFFNVTHEEILGTNTSHSRFYQYENTNFTHIVLSDDEKELLGLYKQLSHEEQLRLLGYVAGRIDKSNQ